MTETPTTSRRRWFPAAGVAGGTIALLLALAVPAGAATVLSSNWAGYVARTRSGGAFSSVSGSWVAPRASCSAGRASYSAVWVGLGGYRQNATSLEQVGTEADCSRRGRAAYSTWLELLPAASVPLHIEAQPGQRLVASVTARGRVVTLRLRNLTTGESFSTTRRIAKLDASSAEWIVEAPSECASSCRTLPLADFGQVSFASATATAAGRTFPAGDGDWRTIELLLHQDAGGGATEASGASSSTGLVQALPSAATAGSGAFSVGWSERSSSGGEGEAGEPPALPGFGGGAG